MQQKTQLHLIGKPGEEAAVPAEIEVWSAGKRYGEALAAFVVCLVLAAASILIPVLHFFLVPGFLIGAVLSAFLLPRRMGRVIKADSACPSCKAKLPLDGVPLKFPIHRRCASCQQMVFVERVEDTGV